MVNMICRRAQCNLCYKFCAKFKFRRTSFSDQKLLAWVHFKCHLNNNYLMVHLGWKSIIRTSKIKCAMSLWHIRCLKWEERQAPSLRKQSTNLAETPSWTGKFHICIFFFRTLAKNCFLTSKYNLEMYYFPEMLKEMLKCFK